MNHGSSSSMNLEKAIRGFISYKSAEGLTDRSLDSYERTLRGWSNHEGDCPLKAINALSLTQYLNWLRSEYTPQRLSGKTHPLSPKTLRNVWITLSSFYSWASQEFGIPNPMKDVPPSKYKKTEVVPYTQDEVERMLKACAYSKEVKPVGCKNSIRRLMNRKNYFTPSHQLGLAYLALSGKEISGRFLWVELLHQRSARIASP